MTPTEAAQLLDLPAHATPDQIEARFHELRTKLEEKIGKAPTPGLKAKYRESLDEITKAFETIALAADSSALPVLRREQGEGRKEKGGAPETGGPASLRAGNGVAATPPRGSESGNRESRIENRKSGGREFAIVAVIAVLVLGAGGWWVMKTRAENAEKARIAAEAKAEADRKAAAEKAEADRKAAEEKRLAEEKRQAEEAEKVRLAAEQKAEQERLERLTGQLRSDLAAAKVEWEALEREERNAERRLSELKSDLRSLRDPAPGTLAEAQALLAAQQDYYDWLSGTLARHPARIARSRAEELLSARQIDAAQAAVGEFKTGIEQLQRELPEERRSRLAVHGALLIKTHPAAAWALVDAFGRNRKGTGPATLEDVAFGPAAIEFSLPLWPLRKTTVTISRTKSEEVVAEFNPGSLEIDSVPAGASVWAGNRELGATPLQLPDLPPGKLTLTLKKAGHYDRPVSIAMSAGLRVKETIKMRTRPTTPVLPTQWIMPARVTMESRTSMTISGARSTGLYGKDPHYSQNQSHLVEELEFSEPDADGQWQSAVRRFVPTATTHPLVTAGSVVRYGRTEEGKWQGEFLEGGVTNAQYNSHVLQAFNPSAGAEWLIRCWPPANTPVGGTWPVPAEAFYPIGALHGGTMSRQGTGRLVSFNREPARDWVELEFTYVVRETAKTSTDENSGTFRVRVDLSGFVMSYETSTRSSSTSKVAMVGILAMDSNSNSTVTYTVR